MKEELIAEAFGHSKKDAKKKVAAIAIETLIPESEVSLNCTKGVCISMFIFTS